MAGDWYFVISQPDRSLGGVSSRRWVMVLNDPSVFWQCMEGLMTQMSVEVLVVR